MNYIKRDLQNLKKTYAEIKDEGFRPVLKRQLALMAESLNLEMGRLIKQALPIALISMAAIAMIAFIVEWPLSQSLMMGGFVVALFGVVQAAGAHGFIGTGRNVPRIYQHMEPSWSATDSQDEQQKLRKERREKGMALMAKLLFVAVALFAAGLIVAAL